ncbi:hypothetical protein GCM10023205_74000 [Yinghuangia aomiensis]|uniref:Uncharacterized protein n=1 Tax=Yinghuangia aomiensis TaxID=676205 RepID=A0ABP9I9C3_9ACTN
MAYVPDRRRPTAERRGARRESVAADNVRAGQAGMLVLADGAAESVVSAYPQALDLVGFGHRFGQRPQWRGLVERGVNGGPSVLKKIVTAWRQLTQDRQSIELVLVTNRAPTPMTSLCPSGTHAPDS